jgi:ABC-type glycerol-3-phosphate transport system permease component
MADSLMTELARPTTGSIRRRRRFLRATIVVVFVFYALITLIPFYFLIVRSFVPTKKTTELWLLPPPAEEVDLDAKLGGLATFLNLDIQQFKARFGIPPEEFVKPQWSLRRIGEEYGIPEEELRDYLNPFIRYAGWFVLLSDELFVPALVRSLVLTVAGIVGRNILGILTGTALAGLRYRYQRAIHGAYMLMLVIPPLLVLLPQYVMVQSALALIPDYEVMGGLTRQAAQILAVLVFYLTPTPLSTMLFTAYISSIPSELEDAARIDGASRWQYLFYIQGPLMRIPVASMTVISIPGIWNDFLHPFLYMDNSATTILPLINTYLGTFSSNYQVIYAGVFISILPLLIVYLSFRRWFIQGAMAGAIKG